MLKVEANGKQIVLSMVGGKVYAVDQTCTHEGGPLDEGELNGYDLQCPWHYAVFDVKMAKFQIQQFEQQILTHTVKVDDTNGDILVNPNGKKI